MSIDCHLKLDGVEGESTHANHKGEIVIHNWEWDLFNKSNVEGGGMGVGKEMPLLRSEERRVGKECRSRWSPYP